MKLHSSLFLILLTSYTGVAASTSKNDDNKQKSTPKRKIVLSRKYLTAQQKIDKPSQPQNKEEPSLLHPLIPSTKVKKSLYNTQPQSIGKIPNIDNITDFPYLTPPLRTKKEEKSTPFETKGRQNSKRGLNRNSPEFRHTWPSTSPSKISSAGEKPSGQTPQKGQYLSRSSQQDQTSHRIFSLQQENTLPTTPRSSAHEEEKNTAIEEQEENTALPPLQNIHSTESNYSTIIGCSEVLSYTTIIGRSQTSSGRSQTSSCTSDDEFGFIKVG